MFYWMVKNMLTRKSAGAVSKSRESKPDSAAATVDTGWMEPRRPYAMPLTFADLPDEVRALLDNNVPLQEPPQQGRTSRVAFAVDARGEPMVIKRSAGQHLDVVRREHRALQALAPLDVSAPAPLLFLECSSPLEQEGWLVTRRLPGTTLEAALRTQPDHARRTSLLTDFGAAVARLHATPPPTGFGTGDWLENALEVAKSLNPAADAGRLGHLRHHQPAPVATALIHGDLFLDNVMTVGERVTGFIDWSFADVGDPRYDVAVATHELTRADREAFAEGYGPAARLTAAETAYFVEVALLF
ncbi:phosphotransferase [Deinococcus sp. HMF7620]|uniref:Phosphotransferase n=1 Tax=Deinococcus arboris TaxID=2682977 RepID=A0A7C9HYM4_9DEIO|nr:aminoglycoside phosphotransferase family protein [Deinococcus arboris]MVN86255.1 phosphotransferase [Deinococcus arboris]